MRLRQRLAQALFWGEYNETFSAGRSGVFEEGVVKSALAPIQALLPQEDRKALGALDGARSLVSIAFIRK